MPPPGPCQPLLPPSLSRPAPSCYLQVRAETRRNDCPSWSPPGWLRVCPCPLLSHAGCPGTILALCIILVLFRTSCLSPRRYPGGEGRSDPPLSHLLGIPVSRGTVRSAGTPAVPLTLSSLHGTAISPGTTACSQRQCTTSGGCASSSACPPTPSTPPSGARRRWVPPDCGIDCGVGSSYGCGLKPPSLLHLTKPLLLSLSSWASTWTERCTPWWCMQWWMKERVRRGVPCWVGLAQLLVPALAPTRQSLVFLLAAAMALPTP